MQYRDRARRQGGFTLIEMVVAISLLSVMAAALVPLGAAALRAHQTTHARLKSQDKLRYAIERMARELREVKFDAQQGFRFEGALTSTPASQVAFTRAYYDAAGAAVAEGTVRLVQSGSEVRLSDSRFPGLPAQVLCDNVAALRLVFLDEVGQVLAAPNALNVYAVEIALSLTSAGLDLSQTTRVALKNRQKT